MMLPTSRRYIEQAFAPRVFAGLLGLGANPTAAEVSALAAAAADGSTQDVAAYKAALTAYYAEGGTYDTAASVQTAERVSSVAAPPSEMAAPQLYAAEECDVRDGACIARNHARQDANLALLENARRAFNLQVCEYNAAINPGQDQPCEQFRTPVPVPAASGAMQTAVCTGGQCYTPILGDTGAVTPAQKAAQKQYASQYTPQGVPLAPPPQVPNQAVPPRPQAGEVPVADAQVYRESMNPESGGLFGMSNTTLAILAAAAVGGIVLMKGKG